MLKLFIGIAIGFVLKRIRKRQKFYVIDGDEIIYLDN